MRQINKLTLSGGILSAVLLSVLLTGQWIAPKDPLSIDLSHRLSRPDAVYLLGTDHLGRCVLSRIIHGTRTSLLSAFGAVALALTAGLCTGFVSGLGSRKTDRLLMGICDIVLAFPFLILALVLTGMMGPSLKSLILGAGMAGWAWWARFVRGMILHAREKDFVRQGKAMGLNRFRIMRHYLLPQILPPLLVAVSLSTGRMIVVISSLSYLGLGVQPPVPEWGTMLRESRIYLASAPWLVIAPGLAVSLSVLAFTLLGEGFRDCFQVRPVYDESA
ncbi:MAG: ABC transporter permease [Desulfobacterales bacterium]